MQLRNQVIEMEAKQERALKAQQRQLLEGGDAYLIKLTETVDDLRSKLEKAEQEAEGREATLQATSAALSEAKSTLKRLEAGAGESGAALDAARNETAAAVQVADELRERLERLENEVEATVSTLSTEVPSRRAESISNRATDKSTAPHQHPPSPGTFLTMLAISHRWRNTTVSTAASSECLVALVQISHCPC